ncbi:hypothetical protein B0H14DRAFT_1697710 [Mycena olivaceomarginata]|nr:hypothetical protein B0H14DRAFT_1697710 [Mycena olivaceomarginata]
MSHSTSGHSPTTASVSTASSTHRGPYNCDPDSVSVPGARSSPLLAPLSFRPFLDVGIDLGHVLDVLHGITNFDAIFRALAAGPFRSCGFTGIYVRFCSPSFDSANLRRNMIGCWYLNAVSSGAPACSSVYPLRQLGELFFLADQEEGPFDFRHFEPGGR